MHTKELAMSSITRWSKGWSLGLYLAFSFFREDFTRLKKVVEKKREAAAKERKDMDEVALAEQMAKLAATADDTLLDDYDAQEQGDVYF